MPYQVDDALLHAMSGTELSRVRTELRLLLLSLTTKDCSRREEPTLLCNQVVSDSICHPTIEAIRTQAGHDHCSCATTVSRVLAEYQ
jgi:hypothetical protein